MHKVDYNASASQHRRARYINYN